MASASKKISIVIPTYRESSKIASDVAAAAAYLHDNMYDGEIIVVDDGSPDGTADAARAVAIPGNVRRQVIAYHPNRGKGCAVRTGILASDGDFVAFVDSGLCIPYSFVDRGIGLIEGGAADIAHGSRKLRESIILRPHPLIRRFFSRLFRLIFMLLLKIPSSLTDTQCGFKIYRGDVARKLYGEITLDGFLFDVEVIMRAQKYGYRIKEFPVEWTADLDTRLSPFKNMYGILRELITLRLHILPALKNNG